MALLAAVHPTPSAPPLLGFLVAGFLLLVAGLAAVTVGRREHGPLHSERATRRALLYVLIYGLCAGCFARIVQPALLAREHSAWLLALGDVLFVTLALFVWVMVLAEDRPLAEYGFRGARGGRMGLAIVMGLAAAALYAGTPALALLTGQRVITADDLVFAVLFASAGSALPEEILFRGYLMGSLDGRAPRWARLALPALVFTAVRSIRFLPGTEYAQGDWLFYVFGVVLPLGLWWGLMRDLAGGSLWPGLISHFTLELVTTLANASPVAHS